MNKKKLPLIATLVVVALVLVDQFFKFWIKTNFAIGQDMPVFGDWFHLHFIENEGMAFGISFGEQIGKFLLTFFRIAVVGFIIYYIAKLIKEEKASTLSIVILSLVVAGAIGNILDCLFYGLIFSESTPWQVAALFPDGGGYAPFMFGRVVDMLYFPLFRIPEGFPLFGGEYFFPAIFNIADACVTLGVIGVLIFSKQIFGGSHDPKEE